MRALGVRENTCLPFMVTVRTFVGKAHRERVFRIQWRCVAEARAVAASPGFFIKQGESAARILQLPERNAVPAVEHLAMVMPKPFSIFPVTVMVLVPVGDQLAAPHGVRFAKLGPTARRVLRRDAGGRVHEDLPAVIGLVE